MRKVRLDMQKPRINPLQNRVTQAAATIVENSFAASQVFEQANLTIQQSLCLVHISTVDAQSNALDVGEDFARSVKSIVTFEYNRLRGVKRQCVLQEIERLVRHRVGMGIGEKGPLQASNGYSASHVHFPHQVRRQLIEKFISVEVVILGIQV